MKKLVSSLVAVSVLAVGAVPAFASADTPINQAQVNSVGQISEALKSKVEPYVKIENKQFKLVNEDKLKKKISSNELVAVKQSIQQANEAVKGNAVVRVNGNSLIVTVAPSGMMTLAKEGKNDVSVHWWGWELWVSQSLMQKLVTVGIGGVAGGWGWAVNALGKAVAVGVIADAIKEFGKDYIPAIYAKGYWLSVKEMVIKRQ
ncbi:hypothetical protein [Thermoactinomyces sp. DSM 45892]|uniref:hypothetical protein n=1 Tax=Thermoactinomyces sp. DSM 45892 TaxID=1882753 RepID=UPI0008964B03|nr:hypothetical protein [Thermoactinomyces sp. DSM 45892]SDY72263.1 hypothetical protein SAMN05444416_107176 [Thermoactinomyces sp. DSM 45892]